MTQLTLIAQQQHWRNLAIQAYRRHLTVGAPVVTVCLGGLAYLISQYVPVASIPYSFWLGYSLFGVGAAAVLPLPLALADVGPYPTAERAEKVAQLQRAYQAYRAAEAAQSALATPQREVR